MGNNGTTDPTLLGRLAGIDIPALVLWGDADRIVDTDYGRAFAEAMPGRTSSCCRGPGMCRKMETPEVLLRALETFVGD